MIFCKDILVFVGETPRPVRDVRDPRVLRGMAHPFRLTLLDLVERRGTLTSAEASALTGENTASCSFHLRQLAKYGFIERAAAADGRERPWKRAWAGERVPASDDPELNRAAAEVSKLFVDRVASEAVRWMDTRAELPPQWLAAASVSEELLYVTAAELRSLSLGLADLIEHYRGRTADPSTRPSAARPVRVATLLFPLPDEDAQLGARAAPDASSQSRTRSAK